MKNHEVANEILKIAKELDAGDAKKEFQALEKSMDKVFSHASNLLFTLDDPELKNDIKGNLLYNLKKAKSDLADLRDKI